GFDSAKRAYYIASNHTDSQKGCGAGLFTDTVAAEQRACATCALAKACGSACMAISEHMTGDPRQPHPINRVLAQIHLSVHLQNRARFVSIDEQSDVWATGCSTA